MKKFLFTSLFAACAAMGLSSCMNGDYDATPNANNGNPNPLATGGGNGGGGGGGGTSGTITCKIDGVSYSFQGNYSILSSGVGSMYTIAGGTSDGTTGRTISVGVYNYTGPKTYDLATEGVGNYGYYPMSNTSDVTVYGTNAAGSPGSGTATVTSDANNRLQGTFSFTANKAMGSGAASSVTVTEGAFDVPKQ